MVKLRLIGTPDEVAKATDLIRDLFLVLDSSRDYPVRSSPLVRRYLGVWLLPPLPSDVAVADLDLPADLRYCYRCETILRADGTRIPVGYDEDGDVAEETLTVLRKLAQ